MLIKSHCSLGHTSRGPLLIVMMNSLSSPVGWMTGDWPSTNLSRVRSLWKICVCVYVCVCVHCQYSHPTSHVTSCDIMWSVVWYSNAYIVEDFRLSGLASMFATLHQSKMSLHVANVLQDYLLWHEQLAMRHQCLRTEGGREQERKEGGRRRERGRGDWEKERWGKGEKKSRQRRKGWELVEERDKDLGMQNEERSNICQKNKRYSCGINSGGADILTFQASLAYTISSAKTIFKRKKVKKLYNDPVTTTTYSYFKYVHCSLEEHFTEHPGFVGSCLSVSLLSLCVHCLLQETH